jgi:biotin carboxyl carrier protein
MFRRMLRLLPWPVTLAVLAGLLGLAYALHTRMQRERAAEAGEAEQPRRAEHGVVKLGAKLAESHGIKDEPARGVSWVPRLTVYGRVVPNPQATAEVRSPFAGTLRADPYTPWPGPGRPVRAGQVLGRVDIRAGPQERLDLQAKLAEARAGERGAEDVLKVRQAQVDRLQKNAERDVVSRRELDDGLVALADARAQLAKARAGVGLWEKALDALDQRGDRPAAAWSEPLTAPADGEVTELTARPGTSIEAGGLIARVVDFRRALVRLDVPPEALVAGPPPVRVDLLAAGTSPSSTDDALNHVEALAATSPVLATLVGPAPQVDTASQFAGYWYEVVAGGVSWRPGLFVQAPFKAPGARPREAVSVPLAAVLIHQGRTLVYVRIAPGRYERREVRVLGRDGDRWVLAAGVAAGEPVVYRHAQVLLSEEFRGDVDE